jgi:chromosome partitioning protein
MAGLSLALANLKPGTGKTTSAVWLAHVFAQAGNSVLLVDADPAGSALEWSDLAAMYPGLPLQGARFPFRIVALPSRELHRRVPEIARADDVVIIDPH